MRLGCGDPGLQKEGQARPMEPSGGLDRDKDVLQPQPGGSAAPRHGGGGPCLWGDSWDGRMASEAGGEATTSRRWQEPREAADVPLKVDVKNREEGEDEERQPATEPSLHRGVSNSFKIKRRNWYATLSQVLSIAFLFLAWG